MPADLRCVCLLAVCSTSLGLVLTQREQHSQTPPLNIWETINSRRENFLHHNIRRYSSSWILDDGVELPAFVTVQGDPRVHQKVKVKVTTPTQVHHLHLKKLESILHPDVKIVSITGHSNGKPDFIVEDIEPLVRERSQHFFHNPETGTVVSLWKHAAGHYLIEGHLDHATVIEPPGSRSRHTRDTDKKSHSVYRSVDGHEDIGSVGVVSPDQSSGSELVKSFASLLLKYELTPKSNGPATDKSISKEDQNRASLRERLKNVLERQSDFSAFPGSRHHEFLASDNDDHDDDFVEVPAVFENKSKWKVEKGRAERTSVDDGDKKPSKDQKMKHWPGLSTNIWAYEEARNRSHKFDRHHPRAKRQVATDWTSSLMPGYFEGDAGKTVVRKDGNYVVEVMTMVDARTYEDFNYDWMALQIYLLHFWQGVNARFQDIGDPKVRLKVKSINKVAFSGYQPFIENNRIDNSTGRVDVNGLLTEFMTYISNHYESNPALPDHDIAILLTGEDLCKKKADGTWSQKSKGIAFVRGGCISSRRFLNQSYDVGVVEVGRGFRGILTAAHEVGHLLGAFHDGEKNSSSCSSSSGHLMSHVWADPYLYNRFSNCSRQNFKHFMENTWYSECLLSSDSNYTTGYEFPPHWAGEVSSIEDQCHQYIEGIPCVGVSLESQCGQLCCEKWTQQFPSKEPAVDGTFCGVGKMCYNGECVTKRVGQ